MTAEEEEKMLPKKWKELVELEVEAAGDAGLARVLGEFKLLCAGRHISSEELEQMCKDELFRVPTKNNKESRILGFREVESDQ